MIFIDELYPAMWTRNGQNHLTLKFSVIEIEIVILF